MQFRDQIDFVRQHVKKNRMRVFTTILATTMGCAFLIVLASIAFGLQGTVEKEIMTDDSLTKIEVYEGSKGKINREKIKAIDQVTAVVKKSNIDGNLLIKTNYDKRSTMPETMLIDYKEAEKANIKLSEGSYPTNNNEVIIGYHLNSMMYSKADEKAIENNKEDKKLNVGMSASLLGKKINLIVLTGEKNEKVMTKKMTVVGIKEKPKKEWMMDSSILLSQKFAEELMPAIIKINPETKKEEVFYSSYEVYAKNVEAVKAVNTQLKDMDLSTYTVTEQLDQMNLLFLALKAGLIFVGTIAVLIASIGIFNTMSMAVTERTREIGVMKAIGASPKLIQRLFIMESAYIGLIGTAIAVAISYIISMAANFFIPKIVTFATKEDGFENNDIIFSTIPFELVIIASAISIGVAILSGWRPARKATKTDVIQALRQD
ncbi:ABC transporter permease [Kurthia sibirica]|uniref:ABC transporter permease n=1 Tax=Kurthia sibirica TaxID=202750 RepID=A0A2U3AQ37_9BACL|nr:FtsX-like permease family protein [Kurthia sibirica]PWI26670.1 ABC transporter permease [Kurthia sibirica]GEK32935.1 ABC transporter permease YtrF [Kurthia sibirica]